MKAFELTTRMVYTHSTSRWWRPIGRSPMYLIMAAMKINRIVRGKCPNISYPTILKIEIKVSKKSIMQLFSILTGARNPASVNMELGINCTYVWINNNKYKPIFRNLKQGSKFLHLLFFNLRWLFEVITIWKEAIYFGNEIYFLRNWDVFFFPLQVAVYILERLEKI